MSFKAFYSKQSQHYHVYNYTTIATEKEEEEIDNKTKRESRVYPFQDRKMELEAIIVISTTKKFHYHCYQQFSREILKKN